MKYGTWTYRYGWHKKTTLYKRLCHVHGKWLRGEQCECSATRTKSDKAHLNIYYYFHDSNKCVNNTL